MLRFILGTLHLVYNGNFCLFLPLPPLLWFLSSGKYYFAHIQLVGSGRRYLLPFFAHLKHYLCLTEKEFSPLQSNRNGVNAFSLRVRALMGSGALKLLPTADHFGETENAHEPPTTLIPTGGCPKWKPHPRKEKAGTASDGLQMKQCLLLLNIINKRLNNTRNQTIAIIIK